MTTARQPADIETASEDYASRFAGATGNWMLSRQTRIVMDLLCTHPEANIVDVGGGHAQLARPLAESGFAITVHGSAPACSARIQDLLDRDVCTFVCASMFELPFDDAAIDTVLCFRLIIHCDAWPRLIEELCRIAKRAVIIDYPTSQSLNALSSGLFACKKKLEGNTRSWRLFSNREMDTVFAEHGFRCRRRRKQFFLPMVLHRILHCPALSAALEGCCRSLGLTRLWGSPVIAEFERIR